MHDGPFPDVLGTTIPIIANAKSGGGHSGDEIAALEALFAEQGMRAQVLSTGEGGIAKALQEALRHDPPVVVAAGGDGTVNAVAHELRGRSTALAVIPVGTFNHFAKDLGIPLEPKDAVRLLLEGRRVAIDVGEVNGQTFVNNSSLGLYPGMVRTRERLQRRFGHGKRMAMLWAIAAAMKRSPLMTLRLQADHEEEACRSPFVFVGNNVYAMEGFEIGTRERLDCGRLSVYTTHRCSVGGLALLALRALFGRLRQAEDFAALTARRLRVETPRARLLVATDGEVSMMETPLEFRVVPGALNVVVPKEKKE